MFGKLCHKYYKVILTILRFVFVFLFKNILSAFHWVLCFCWKAENVPRKSHWFVFIAEVQRRGLLPSSVHHLCVWVWGFSPHSPRLVSWVGDSGVPLAVTRPVPELRPIDTSANTSGVCGLRVPVTCRTPSQIPSFTVAAHPIWFVVYESNLWASLRNVSIPRSAASEGPSHRSSCCWISLPTLPHHDHFPQDHIPLWGWWLLQSPTPLVTRDEKHLSSQNSMPKTLGWKSKSSSCWWGQGQDRRKISCLLNGLWDTVK